MNLHIYGKDCKNSHIENTKFLHYPIKKESLQPLPRKKRNNSEDWSQRKQPILIPAQRMSSEVKAGTAPHSCSHGTQHKCDWLHPIYILTYLRCLTVTMISMDLMGRSTRAPSLFLTKHLTDQPVTKADLNSWCLYVEFVKEVWKKLSCHIIGISSSSPKWWLPRHESTLFTESSFMLCREVGLGKKLLQNFHIIKPQQHSRSSLWFPKWRSYYFLSNYSIINQQAHIMLLPYSILYCTDKCSYCYSDLQ